VTSNNLCEYLEWDSDFFGVRIARLTVTRLTPQTAQEVDAWCEANKVSCLYFLADADDASTLRVTEANAYHFVDIRMTLDRALSDAATPEGDRSGFGGTRPATQEDLPNLRAIARVSHSDSRFYYDPHLPDARCDDLYETWIDKSVNGYADAVLVAELEGAAVGYITCHLRDDAAGQIGLVGVSAQAQGRGLGGELINAALGWFRGQGVQRVSVVTQGRNCPAQRLYGRSGFLTRSVQLWYHKWYLGEGV
jgi:dTDP-4-amino-4,6-dideoxy-D-galactose acyltransferase